MALQNCANQFSEWRPSVDSNSAIFAIHHHVQSQAELLFRRLPMPWVCLTVRISGETLWRENTNATWEKFPRVALRGIFDTWTEGLDLDRKPHEYLVALFEPWAVQFCFGLHALGLRNRIVDLQQHAQTFGTTERLRVLLLRLREAGSATEKKQLLAECLLQNLRWQHHPSLPLLTSIQRLRLSAGNATVPELSELASMSERGLSRNMLSVCGMSTKPLARLVRFGACLAHLHCRPWAPANYAIELPDFHDQSHFSHEFRRYSGISPRRYQKQKLLNPRTVFTV
jgi:AraC-like DNA-binding protein